MRVAPHPYRTDAVVVLFPRTAPVTIPRGCVGDRENVAVSLPRLRCLGQANPAFSEARQ